MDSRCSDVGHVTAELTGGSPSSDIHEFESFYNFTQADKLSHQQQTRFPGEFPSLRFNSISGSSRDHVMDLRGLNFSTSVSVEESDFLEEFMSCDFSSSRDKSNVGSLTDLSFSGSLSELDNLPRTSDQNIVGSNPGFGVQSSYTSKYPSYHHEQENRLPGTRRIHSTYATTSQPSSGSASHVGSKSLKVMKHKMSSGGNSSENSSGGGGGSLLRQQLQGSLCSNKYRKAQETLCRECSRPITAKCLLKTCKKSDEVLCPDCGQELTAKCLLKSCSGHK